MSRWRALWGCYGSLCKMRQPLGWSQGLKLLTQLTEVHATQSCTSASRKHLNDCGVSVIPGATTYTFRDRNRKQKLKAQQQLHRFHIPRQLGTRRVRCASIRMRALIATHEPREVCAKYLRTSCPRRSQQWARRVQTYA